jgi:hypothetical protein
MRGWVLAFVVDGEGLLVVPRVRLALRSLKMHPLGKNPIDYRPNRTHTITPLIDDETGLYIERCAYSECGHALCEWR